MSEIPRKPIEKSNVIPMFAGWPPAKLPDEWTKKPMFGVPNEESIETEEES